MDFIEPCFGIGHNLSLICQMTSEDIKHQLIIVVVFSACKNILLFLFSIFYLVGRPAVRPNRNHHAVAGIAHLVERPAEKPDAVLSRVRIPGAARLFFLFSPRVSFQCRLSDGVRTVPLCNHMHQRLSVRYKSQTVAVVPPSGHTKMLQLNTDRNG